MPKSLKVVLIAVLSCGAPAGLFGGDDDSPGGENCGRSVEFVEGDAGLTLEGREGGIGIRIAQRVGPKLELTPKAVQLREHGVAAGTLHAGLAREARHGGSRPRHEDEQEHREQEPEM